VSLGNHFNNVLGYLRASYEKQLQHLNKNLIGMLHTTICSEEKSFFT
jgi:hypothetical protein